MGKVVVNVHKLLSRANQDVLQAFTIAGDGDLGQVSWCAAHASAPPHMRNGLGQNPPPPRASN